MWEKKSELQDNLLFAPSIIAPILFSKLSQIKNVYDRMKPRHIEKNYNYNYKKAKLYYTYVLGFFSSSKTMF